MKKFIALATAAIIAISASAETTKKFGSDEFSSVKVLAPVHVVYNRAPFYSVRVFSRNKELTSAVKYTVKDGVLRISANDMDALEQANSTVTVVVTAPETVEYKLAGDMERVANKRPDMKAMPHFGRHK